jgi:prolyl-tRNA synthetase
MTTGANEDDHHLRNVDIERDVAVKHWLDLREVREGEGCPSCGDPLRVVKTIEVGHIFKLGTFFSRSYGTTYLDEAGEAQLILMGSYGIGPGRTMAAIIEQHHDDKGIQWPPEVAPYDVHVIALQGLETQANAAATALDEGGFDVLLDDRDARAGEKFADADLIGCPLRLTVGRKAAEDGTVDLRERTKGEDVEVSVGELVMKAREMLG